jgi:hypothetical protein
MRDSKSRTAFLQYFWTEVWPRRTEILSGNVLLAIATGAAVASYGDRLISRCVGVTELGTAFLAYASIGLGFCVAGMTVALTFPDKEFVERLAKLSVPGRYGNALSALLFVFSWTAVVHWCTIVLMLVVLFLRAGQPVFPESVTRLHRAGMFVCVTSSCYCLFQFLVTVITLSQLGGAYSAGLKRPEKPSQTQISNRTNCS